MRGRVLTQERMFYYNDPMSSWRNLLIRLGLFPGSRPHYFELDETQYTALENLSHRERRSIGEITSELVTNALNQRSSQKDLVLIWRSLSPREQAVAALVCLGYTNHQIGTKLSVSDETVKTHLHNAMLKFKLHTRSEIQSLLARWDFSAWDRQR